MDEQALSALRMMQSNPGGPHTAVRVALTLHVPVAVAQRYLAALEAEGYIARPTGAGGPFFHLTPQGRAVQCAAERR